MLPWKRSCRVRDEENKIYRKGPFATAEDDLRLCGTPVFFVKF